MTNHNMHSMDGVHAVVIDWQNNLDFFNKLTILTMVGCKNIHFHYSHDVKNQAARARERSDLRAHPCGTWIRVSGLGFCRRAKKTEIVKMGIFGPAVVRITYVFLKIY